MTEIRFSLPTEMPFGALSNYCRRPVFVNGIRYASAEHAYQAAKAQRPIVQEWVAHAPSSVLAAVAGDGLPEDEIVKGWETRRVALMRTVLEAKFTQHDDLREMLLSTGSAPLVEWAYEDSAANRFWSKVNGEGQNMLGQLLMELRCELKKRANASHEAGTQRSARPTFVRQRFG